MADAGASVVVQPQAGGGQVTIAQAPQSNGRGTITTIAGGLVDSVRTLPPVLLLIVILNIAFAGAGAGYLMKVEEYRAEDRKALSDLLRACIVESVPLNYFKMGHTPP